MLLNYFTHNNTYMYVYDFSLLKCNYIVLTSYIGIHTDENRKINQHTTQLG